MFQRRPLQLATRLLNAAQRHTRSAGVQSFITVDDDQVRRSAADIDERIRAGDGSSLGPLAGVVMGIKDTLCTQGLRTTAGSRMLENYTPPYDATSVGRLRKADMLLAGKCNCDAFAMGSTTEASDYHVTRNPWDQNRVPGGSSGGSAAAVAAGQCIATLGSDTGGSIRQPASFCGVVGIKPTYGRVSRYGLIAYASSLDCVGPLARCVEDAAAVLNVISGHDKADATSSTQDIPDFTQGLEPRESLQSRPLQGVRIGVVQQMMGEGVAEGVTAAVDRACRHLESLGAELLEVVVPSLELGTPAYYVLATSEASSNLARYDGIRYGLSSAGEKQELKALYRNTRGTGLNAEVKRRILMGTHALSAGFIDAYYKRAQQVRTLIRQGFHDALQQVDVLIGPAAPTPAFELGTVINDPLTMYKNDVLTVGLNLAGLPAVAVPCGFDDKTASNPLPVCVQIMGRAFDEARLIKVAHVFEQTADFAFGIPDSCSQNGRI
ncbi:hypothetical protein WJX73_004326 [Symbiochloris irregularis]|uniref:Glutamyl-tRNA(Gln) amidotransferase subunit A, chloroplastic/mitochondrial n=1 Tax=Symbiochloris irregularis TaxID=706552 RepID=A0AAW1NQ02_9CHLO